MADRIRRWLRNIRHPLEWIDDIRGRRWLRSPDGQRWMDAMMNHAIQHAEPDAGIFTVWNNPTHVPHTDHE